MWQTILNEMISQLQANSFLVGLCVAVLAIALWSTRRSVTRVRSMEKQLKQARNDLKALTTASLGVGSRVLELERRLRRIVAEKHNQNQSQHQKKDVDIFDSANDPYDYAIDLARQGMEVDEIATMCGISRNEAELIQMMNRFKQAS